MYESTAAVAIYLRQPDRSVRRSPVVRRRGDTSESADWRVHVFRFDGELVYRGKKPSSGSIHVRRSGLCIVNQWAATCDSRARKRGPVFTVIDSPVLWRVQDKSLNNEKKIMIFFFYSIYCARYWKCNDRRCEFAR